MAYVDTYTGTHCYSDTDADTYCDPADGDTGSDGYVSTYANAYPYAYTSANGNSCTNAYPNTRFECGVRY